MVLDVYSSAVGAALAPWGAALSAGMGCISAISVNHKWYPRTPKDTEFAPNRRIGSNPVLQAEIAAPEQLGARGAQLFPIFLQIPSDRRG
jgi:hypothetical protein